MRFNTWIHEEENKELKVFCEEVSTSRYSIEVNYRSKSSEVLDAFAKLALGYMSAALKKKDFHVKHVFSEKPLRILVSTRNWDDGEWIGVVAYNPQLNCFVIGKGFYNRDRRSVSVHHVKKCSGQSAADVASELVNFMNDLKKLKPRDNMKLKPAPLKRGPKK